MGLSKELLYFMVYFKFHFLGDPPPKLVVFFLFPYPPEKTHPFGELRVPSLEPMPWGKLISQGPVVACSLPALQKTWKRNKSAAIKHVP